LISQTYSNSKLFQNVYVRYGINIHPQKLKDTIGRSNGPLEENNSIGTSTVNVRDVAVNQDQRKGTKVRMANRGWGDFVSVRT